MSKKAETNFSEKVKKDLDLIPDGFFFKLMAGAIRGLPDRVGCKRGRFVALELKVPGKEPDALQGWTLRKLRNAGAFVAVATPDNWSTIYFQIKNL